MAGLEPAPAYYGPTDFKSVAFPRECSAVDTYLTHSASVHYQPGRLPPGQPIRQLALIFGFDVLYELPGHVLVYSDAGLLQDQQLVYGDNQFLLEIESLDLGFDLYFIHAGGYWFFTGLSGYVV